MEAFQSFKLAVITAKGIEWEWQPVTLHTREHLIHWFYIEHAVFQKGSWGGNKYAIQAKPFLPHMPPRQKMEAGMRGRLYNEQCKDSFQSSDLTCEKQCISGTSCSLHIMTQIIGSLMGSLALSVQPATPFWRTGEHRINLGLLGRAVKHGMHPKDISSTSRCVSLSLSLFF